MKKIITLSIICFFMLAYSTGKAQVFTSGFENWSTATPPKLTDWWGSKSTFVADSITQSTSSHTGTYAACLKARKTTVKYLSTIPVSITAGQAYYFSFWVKGHGSICTGLYKGGSITGTAQTKLNSYIVVNSSIWTQYTQAFAADSTSSAAQFVLAVKSTFADLGDVQVDDVNIISKAPSTVTIHNIQYTTAPNGDSPYNDSIVTTSGIVTGRNSTTGYFIQDGKGPWSGVYVYDKTYANTISLAVGDLVTVTGLVSEYNNLTEISLLGAISRTSAGNTLPTADTVTVVNSTSESLEGVLVTLLDLPCLDTTGYAKYGDWTILNGTDTTNISGFFYKYVTPAKGTNYNVTGIVYYTGGKFYVEPRNANDVSIITGINEIGQNNVSIYPNPVASILNVANMNGIETIRISNILGETIKNIKVSGTQEAINMTDLSKGIYFVSLINISGVITTKKISKE